MSIASLRNLELDDIQLVRYWRNLDHVRNRMAITDYIARDEQRDWFGKIDEKLTKYFIYSLDSRDVGCVSITKINYADKTFEGGIFCGDALYLNHWVNIWACVKIYNYAFYQLDLDKSFATILNDNNPALSLNKSLGYVHLKDSDCNVSRFILNRDNYTNSTKTIREYLRRFVGQDI